MKTANIKIAGIVLAIFVTIFALFQFSTSVQAYITLEAPVPTGTFKNCTFFATTTNQTWYATTTSATSTNITPYFDAEGRLDDGSCQIAGAKAASVYFSRGGKNGANVGTSTFKLQVTPNGTDWYDFSKMIQPTSTTQVSSVAVGAGTTTVTNTLDLTSGAWKALRCIVVETTDGDHGCAASVSF